MSEERINEEPTEEDLGLSTNSINYLGIEIKKGNYYKIVFSRYCYYVKVIDIPSPNYLLCLDIYGHKCIIRLGKTIMISELTEKEFMAKKIEQSNKSNKGKKKKKSKKKKKKGGD